jgi:outer membrane protein insertion porin family
MFSDFGTLGLLDTNSKNSCYKTTASNCVRDDIKDDLSLRASAGVSIFWKSPMGPIRFDFSKVLAKEAYDRPETFRFSTSTRF